MHRSAFRDTQEQVSKAYDQGCTDTRDAVAIWLEQHREQAEFAAVLVAFRADFYEAVDGDGSASVPRETVA